MSLYRTVRTALWVPVAAVALPYAYSLAVMHLDPSSSLSARGVPLLSAMAGLGMLVELVAVPTSLWLLVTDDEYRTASSIYLTALGLVPIAGAVLLGVAAMYGH